MNTLPARSTHELSPAEYHARRAQRRFEQREAHRLEWLAKTREAISRIAPRFPAVRVAYLFGSLVDQGRFREDSDLDVAVDCDDVAVETPFWRALELALERDVDLRPRIEGVALAVKLRGVKVYEREDAATAE